jgi:hypothetical protein
MSFDQIYDKYIKQALYNRNSIFYIVAAIHIIWGMILLANNTSPEPVPAPLNSLNAVIKSVDTLAWMLITISIGTMVIIHCRFKCILMKPFLLLPQQLLVTWSAFGAIICMATGTFPDGTTHSYEYVIIAQFPIVSIAIFHMISLIYNFVAIPFRRFE